MEHGVRARPGILGRQRFESCLNALEITQALHAEVRRWTA
jgi:hypothetical protein